MSTSQNSLIPFHSTHFRLTSMGGYHSKDITLGKIYRIERWLSEEDISFRDDAGDPRSWYICSLPLRDVSYETLLEKVLE